MQLITSVIDLEHWYTAFEWVNKPESTWNMISISVVICINFFPSRKLFSTATVNGVILIASGTWEFFFLLLRFAKKLWNKKWTAEATELNVPFSVLPFQMMIRFALLFLPPRLYVQCQRKESLYNNHDVLVFFYSVCTWFFYLDCGADKEMNKRGWTVARWEAFKSERVLTTREFKRANVVKNVANSSFCCTKLH